MPQCISCQHAVMHEQPRGKCLCWKETDGTRNLLDVMAERKCALWKLGVMDQVKRRSKRRMVFNEQGVCRLE